MNRILRLSAAMAKRCIEAALAEKKIGSEHQQWISDDLVSTSLHGVDTHGIRLLETYLREFTGGRANVSPQMKITRRLPAVAVLDADNANGIVAGVCAMKEAIEIARVYGIGAVSVQNSNHFGAAGYYARMAAENGMIGISLSNSDALVAPFNGIDARNGTNPISVVAKGEGDDLFLLDMATSQIAVSKVLEHLREGKPLAPGWAIDRNGKTLELGQELHALMALGGYKGQGLGMMVQLLTAVLSSMPLDADLSFLYRPPYDQPRQVSHLFICLNVEAFRPVDDFKKQVSALLNSFRTSPSIRGEPVLAPGDKERVAFRERSEHGIPLSESEYEWLLSFEKSSGQSLPCAGGINDGLMHQANPKSRF